MSANSESGGPPSREEASILDIVPGEWRWGNVLVTGPAMVGKQGIAIDLLTTAHHAGGQPLAITTADTADQMRRAYYDSGGEETENLAVVNCLTGSDETSDDDWTRTVGSPGDFTGIAMAVSDVFDSVSPQRRSGTRVLVDNLATSLMYADIEPTYRFVHALAGRVSDAGGVLIATLDTDGVEPADNRALVGLFDTVVEIRRSDDRTEFSVSGAPDTTDEWYRLPSGGVSS
jgi:hypothetical protein